MQGLLAHNENRSPQSPIPRGVYAGGANMRGAQHFAHTTNNVASVGKNKRMAAILVVVGVCTLLLLYGASGSGGDHTSTTTPTTEAGTDAPTLDTPSKVAVSSSTKKTSKGGVATAIVVGGGGSLTNVPVWGYNKDRNIPRWKAISTSIAGDNRQGAFTVVDYGADQGFFSISTAAAFPTARVIGLELGGVGGEIWKKKNSQDVLEIQEQKVKELRVEGRMMICQTMVKPEHFSALEAVHSVSDYQYVLSVFHWFDLKTREDFEKTIAALLRNSKTTFIELPTIGDNSKLIRQQVGWENFVKWYDGRTDTGIILREAAEAHNIVVKVTPIASVPWIRWTRVVHRIDVVDETVSSTLLCKERRQIYGCNTERTLHQSCTGYDE